MAEGTRGRLATAIASVKVLTALVLSVIRRLPSSLFHMEESMIGYMGVN
jgi:hypothetical protein